MTTRSALVAEARKWVGTPYTPRRGKAGQGADCAFLQYVMVAALGSFPIRTDYPMMPKNREIEKQLDKVLDVVWIGTSRRLRFVDLKPGRIALFEFSKDEPQHMGMIAEHQKLPNDARTVIHALGSPQRRGRVAENMFASRQNFGSGGGEFRSSIGTLIKLYDAPGVTDG